MPPVERLEVEEAPVRHRPKLVTEPSPPPPAPEPPKTVDPRRLELMLRVVVQVLSLRAIMLLSMIGAFVLATRAMADQTYMALGVLGVYCLFGIIPIAYLEIRRKTE